MVGLFRDIKRRFGAEEISPKTFRFGNEETETAFLTERLDPDKTILRYLTVIASILVLSFIFSDALVFKPEYWPGLAIAGRGSLAAVGFLLFALLKRVRSTYVLKSLYRMYVSIFFISQIFMPIAFADQYSLYSLFDVIIVIVVYVSTIDHILPTAVLCFSFSISAMLMAVFLRICRPIP